MLKRFYSKRSGFTLVEIIVAFAVFSIMAAMIVQLLELSIRARTSNNEYALQLAQQEKILTVVERDQDYFNATDKTGYYELNFIDFEKPLNVDYQVKAADPSLANQAEGLNYFLSDVDYAASTDGKADSDMNGNGMSQSARMDTRITGTAGIDRITFSEVYKDECEYSPDSPFYLKDGYTRYWFEVSASYQNDANQQTMRKEDVPYAQYRIFFYSDELDVAESKKVWKDANKKEYTKDVYQQAEVLKVGHINENFSTIRSNGGLKREYVTNGTTTTDINSYLVQALGNSVRIGTPFGSSGGYALVGSKPSRFYVEFKGDPHLTANSFGHNGVKSGSKVVYKVFPQYKDELNADGTPKYTPEGAGKVHPCIYGAYLFNKHYK